MADETWGELDLSPDERAELHASIEMSEEEEARGDYSEYGPGDREKFLEDMIAEGRALLMAEQRKAS